MRWEKTSLSAAVVMGSEVNPRAEMDCAFRVSRFRSSNLFGLVIHAFMAFRYRFNKVAVHCKSLAIVPHPLKEKAFHIFGQD